MISSVVVPAADLVALRDQATGLSCPIVLTQRPVGSAAEKSVTAPQGLRMIRDCEGARLVLVMPDGHLEVLSTGFASACEADVSWDAKRVLFAGKRATSDPWNIFEIDLETRQARQVTHDLGDCRQPIYESSFFTITEVEPWDQIGFVSTKSGQRDEAANTPATHLYTCKPDGSFVQRITYNVSSDSSQAIGLDGRLLYSTWHRATLDDGPLGRIALENINVDGSDRSAFVPRWGPRIQHMPCFTTNGYAVFVTTDVMAWDGAGTLARVSLRRPLHSYEAITDPKDGLFVSPAPLPDGRVLVSRRPSDGSGSYGIFALDIATKRLEPVFDDPAYHDIQAKAVVARTKPDGRSSVVSERDPEAHLYCMNLYTTDFPDKNWLAPGSVKALRVIEGVPAKPGEPVDPSGLSQRRVLAEVPMPADGSFHLVVPANTPIQLQTIDQRGLALRSCGWIWARSHQAQGCIGCHEDPELTPTNIVPEALKTEPASVNRPLPERTTVDFGKTIVPIVSARCTSCHGANGAIPRLDLQGEDQRKPLYEALMGQNRTTPFVHPGRARTSPLIWHVLGQNTARPWDGTATTQKAKPIPHDQGAQITAEEKQALIRWIDLGAPFGMNTSETPTAK